MIFGVSSWNYGQFGIDNPILSTKLSKSFSRTNLFKINFLHKTYTIHEYYDLSPKDISAQSYLQGSVYAL